MALKKDPYKHIAELIFNLRQKCNLKDVLFVRMIGITQSEYNCLVQFYDQERMGVKELSERLGITPGGVTRIITSLENKGYVERRIAPDDRRNINVILTKQGKKIVERIRKVSAEIHEEIFKRIDADSRDEVVKAIQQLLNALDLWLKEHGQELEES